MYTLIINLPHCAAGFTNRNLYINIYLITPLNFVNREKEKTSNWKILHTSEFRRHKVELDEKKYNFPHFECFHTQSNE